MFYALKINRSDMKTYFSILLALISFWTFPLFSQDLSSPEEQTPRVVLASYTESESQAEKISWEHISTLDFFNQSDQVIQYLNTNRKLGALSPNAQLSLAHNLKKQGKYKEAQKWYEAYRQYDYKKGQHFLSSCRKAMAIRNGWEAQRIQAVSINSSESEYSPCISAEGLIFFRMIQAQPGSEEACRFEVLLASGEESTFDDEEAFNQRFQLPENIVFMDISPSGKKVLFTKLTDQSCFNGFLTTEGMATYEADILPNGDWQDIRPLPFNSVGQRTAYATYGESDDMVYFASDIPSGFGGFDIYRAERLNEKSWSTPQNLGPKINSEGNEISPKFNGEVLSFASDYHEGMGGYDIFYSPTDQSKFLNPVNAGRPINSAMDDWSLSFVDQESGYFVSNRANASADANIYYFEDLVETPKPQALQVNYSTKSKEQAVTAFPLDWSNSQMEAFHNTPDKKAPIRTKYSVQIAVISPNNQSFSRLQDELGDLDELYKIYFKDVVKIRLGSYDKEINASLMLEKIKSRGYKDAFIVTEKMIVAGDKNDEQPSQSINSNSSLEAKTTSKNLSAEDGEYLLRLATYLHPDNFDSSKVDGLGTISSLEKGPYTIFLLGHFDSIDQARRAQSEVQSRGFSNAQIIRLKGQDIVRVSLD